VEKYVSSESSLIVRTIFEQEAKDMNQRLVSINKDSDNALKEMERWSKREKETDDYAITMYKYVNEADRMIGCVKHAEVY
jgi:hypothetical protein